MDIATIGLIDDEDILLDLASLALSALDHPNADLGRYLAMLEEMEDQICSAGRGASRPEDQAAVLSRVLHDDIGFVGDTDGYDAPTNADFMRVLDRKRGLPIALSVLYVAMARRAGWSAYVLNLPGHVLVQLGEDKPVIVDPFAGGSLASARDIVEICRTFIGEDGNASTLSIARMNNRDVLARLLNNQAIRAASENDVPRAVEMYHRITRVAPSALDAWENLARLQLAFGDVAGARKSLFAMAEVAPDKATRDRIVDAFERLGPSGATQ